VLKPSVQNLLFLFILNHLLCDNSNGKNKAHHHGNNVIKLFGQFLRIFTSKYFTFLLKLRQVCCNLSSQKVLTDWVVVNERHKYQSYDLTVLEFLCINNLAIVPRRVFTINLMKH